MNEKTDNPLEDDKTPDQHRLYTDASRAEIGTTIRCSNCERLILKNDKTRLFCDIQCKIAFDHNSSYAELDSHITELKLIKYRYVLTRTISVGEFMQCPTCSRRIMKKTYNHKFCNTDCNSRYSNLTGELRLMELQKIRR